MNSEMPVVERACRNKFAFRFLLELGDVLGLVGKLSMSSFVWFDAGNYPNIPEFATLAERAEINNFAECARFELQLWGPGRVFCDQVI